MNDIRRYINILKNALKNASNNELQKYRDERAKYWPVSRKLMAQYRDGLHVEDRNGTLIWMQNNQPHRDGDKPALIGRDGTLLWCQNGLAHRDGDKPAWIWEDGKLEWYQNNQVHRFVGPAVIYPNSKPEWYWRGEKIPVTSQEEFIEYLKKHKGLQRFRVNK